MLRIRLNPRLFFGLLACLFLLSAVMILPARSAVTVERYVDISQGTNPSKAQEAPQIPIAWSIFNAHEADGSLATKILVWILDGFTGTLPDDIDTITVTGPGGVLPYTKDDFVYKAFANPPWSGLLGRFALTIPGSPALGEYTVNVVSGTSESGIRKDVQTVNRSIPIIGTATFSPGNGATLSSKTPSFSWKGIDYSEAPVYYQLQIMDMSNHLLYFSGREKGMVAWTLPVGLLSPGETYQWRLITADDSDYTRIQNRSYTDWFTFTMADTLTHNALPAIDGGSTLGVTTWSVNPTNLLFWAGVTDHDGVASDGSSHTLSVTFPDGTTTVPMSANTMNSRAYLFNEKQIRTGTRVFYARVVDLEGNPATPGNYTFTVTDPDGNVGTMVDNLVVSPLDPPDLNTLSPSSAGEQITAFFDNVHVNGLLFDDFDSYADISDLDQDKWNPPPGCASIDNGRVKTTQTDMVGGGTCELKLRDPGSASSIRADIRVSSISSDAAQARVFGLFYNNGNGDVLAILRVRENKVSYGVYEFLVGDSLTLNSIGGGDLMSVALGQTVTVSISWDGTALTFDADGNAATFTPAGPVYPVTRFGLKGIGTRIILPLSNTTPTFNLDPVAGANQHSIRFYDYFNDYVIWNVYGDNNPSLQVPPGLLKPNTYYNCDIRATDAHVPLNISNYAKAPNQQFEIYTGEQAVDPFIEFDHHGVRTDNNELFGPHLNFWVKVHDAQGVPGNIKRVKVIFPDGSTEETLYYADGNPFDAWNKKTSGCYSTSSYLPIAAGTYTFTVEDQEGHIYSTTEELTPDVIGYPAEASIVPFHNTVIGSTAVNFDWDDIPGVAFYRLEIYDEDFERLYALGTTESQYNLAAGFLQEGTLYRYQIRTYREFFEENEDNVSSSVKQFPWMPTFFTSGVSGGSSLPAIDTGGEGVAVYHYTHPGTGGDLYALTFNVEVTDNDGVPENIKRVEVTYPDGVTKKTLIFRGNPYRGENGYYYPEFYTDQSQIPVGTYTFTVTDFDDNTAQITDELTAVNPLPLVTNYSPTDNSETSTRPLFTWDPVPGAAKYEVCIYNAFGNKQLHTSGFLTETGYLIPAGILTPNTTYSYRIMAYRESDSAVDTENASSSGWQRAHFTTALPPGNISGFVYTEDGSTPVSGATVGVGDFNTGQRMGGATTDINGSYTITDLPEGDYRVNAVADGRVRKYWDNTLRHHEATPVHVTPGDTTSNINFSLEPGGTISGQVLSANPGTPLVNISVEASRQDGAGAEGATTDENGNYTVTNLPFGQYRVNSPSPGRWGSGDDGYATQYYNGHTGPDDADLVPISSGSPDATGIDFALGLGGTISGHIYKEDGTTAIPDLHVYAQNYNTGEWMAGANTGQDGSYSLILPSGTYRVRTCASCSDLGYVDEWYDNVYNEADATPVSVTAPNETPNIDFSLAVGATISGTVFQSDGSTPITGDQISVVVYSGDPCGSYEHIVGSHTDSTNGTYSITGVPAGTYYLRTWNSGTIYQGEWWASPTSTVDCTGAQSFTVSTEQTITGKNFQLAEGATISGTVYQSDGTTPITGKQIRVRMFSGDPCGSRNELPDTYTDPSNGTYTFGGVPAGTYYLQTDNRGANYTNEWWAASASTANCSGAESITVTTGNTVTDKNFQLDPGTTISGIVFQSDGTTPITESRVGVQVISGDPCGTHKTVAYASYNSSNGTYQIGGLLPGTYYLNAYTWGSTNYVSEWWASTGSVFNCNGAQSITVTSMGSITGKNFQLDAGATISGTVFQSDGTTPITGVQINVDVHSGDPCGAYHHVAGASTDSTNGTYSITRVPEGTYYLRTWNNETNYQNEWWAAPLSTVNCAGAQSITVSSGQIITDKNFQLDTGATITGTITSDIDGLPVEGVQVCGWPFPGGTGACTTSQSDGSYTLSGLQPGYTKVRASGAGYLTEFYDNSYDQNWATAIWVTTDQTTPNIDFSMGTPGSISGTVYQSDGTTPLPNVGVGAYMHQCGSRYAAAQTDSSGNYTISGLPPGNYYVHTHAAITHPQHYADQWWNSSGDTFICDQAGAVTVASEQDTPGINFSLSPSESTYPGPSFRSAGVFSAHNADGSIITIFYAFINGPSPLDVVSLTATGPSGTFNLGLNQTPFRQLGIFYSTGWPSVVDDGIYTFVVTDSLGRTATVERSFTYDSTVPQVDSDTMKVNGMDNYAYVGTATPTLSWDAVTWPGTPGYYQAFIYDYDGRAIWYQEVTEGTSITIPEGYLPPDSAYYWWVRTGDIPETGERGQNRHYSNTLYFYTGAEGLTPDVSQNIPYSYTDPDHPGATWFGVHNVNLAPWDIDYLRVIGPDGTIYPNGGRSWFGYSNMWYFRYSTGPFPIPDGTYTYEVTDKAFNTYTATKDHTYAYVPTISEASRVPADNTYLYTKTPTFSWNPPNEAEAFSWVSPSETGTFYYSLRIYDYNSRVAWYSSPAITETSFTLPEDTTLKAPFGSYKWHVRVYNGTDGYYDGTNAAISSNRTFTIPPLSQYDYTLPGGTGLPTDYRIFTVPFYMGTGAALLNAMEKGLGPYDPARWRVFSWDGSVYFEIDSEGFESLTIVPGMAFWIISLYADTIQFEGAPCPDDTYYEIELTPGWNMFALPWPATDIYLGDIAISDGVNNYAITSPDNDLTQRCVWDYTGEGPNAGYEEVGSASDLLQAGGGFWILVLVDSKVKMLIPPDDSGNYFSVSTSKGIRSFKANMFGKEIPPLSPGESTRFLSRRPVQSQVAKRALTSSSHDAPAAVQRVLPPN